MPMNMLPTRLYSIVFSGWGYITFDLDDDSFKEAIEIASKTLNVLIYTYNSTHVFTQPQIIYNPKTREITLKIGTLEKEIYDSYGKTESNQNT